MSRSSVPFYAQTTVLDRYIHAPNPENDQEAVDVVVRMLRTKPELRSYFFRSGPNAAWAPILWQHGFFDSPPSPQRTEQGYVLAHWDVQYFLVAVAPEVPNIVMNHVQSISGQGWYISRALQALCKIPTDLAEGALSRIKGWLEQPEIADAISDEVSQLIDLMGAAGRIDSALQLLQAATAPRAPAAQSRAAVPFRGRPDRAPLLEAVFGTPPHPSTGFELLKRDVPGRLIQILETHLVGALRMEAQAAQRPELESSSWWRNAIEDTEQDNLGTYFDRVLCALRDTIEALARVDPGAAQQVAERYLADGHGILRRLGLHFLHKHPQSNAVLVAAELRKYASLDDVESHHEYFCLLKQGFPVLDPADLEELTAQITRGPDKQRTEELAERMAQQYGEDKDKYIESYRNVWIRDRLWMIREYLSDDERSCLDDLVARLGVPEHPDFLVWHSGGFWVRDVSPVPGEQLARLGPDELIALLGSWQPDQAEKFGPEHVSREGLAGEVGSMVVANPERYRAWLPGMLSIRPEYAAAVINRWNDPAHAALVPWDIALRVIEELLGKASTWASQPQIPFEESWLSVRLAIARMLETGLRSGERRIPEANLVSARDSLLKLIDDPDPSLEADRPQEGWAGHKDPTTVALNHVRPIALGALIDYAVICAQGESDTDNKSEALPPSRLEPLVNEALTRKLDKTVEPSRAVHSIFGRYLTQLYWLDKKWVQTNLEWIFPRGEDEESRWFAASAWDAYVLNPYPVYLVDLLRPYYVRAISNLGAGYVANTHLGIAQHLAVHIALEYLFGEYELMSPLGQQSLLVEFFSHAPVEMRKALPWALWRICEDHPNERDAFWPRARRVWEWRNREGIISNHSPDFNDEMEEFVQLLLFAPASLPVAELRPLIEGSLPHIGRSEYRSHGWDSLEVFLAGRVDRDPVGCIRLYQQMYERRSVVPRWSRHSEASRSIVEVAAANPETRQMALGLIDMLARWGDYELRDIYERFS